MEFLTALEVSKILRTSVWWVYKNYSTIGGFKIGRLVRFDKNTFETKVKEVMDNGSQQALREMEIRLSETRETTQEKRIQNETGSTNGGIGSQKESKGSQELDLYRFVREQDS